MTGRGPYTLVSDVEVFYSDFGVVPLDAETAANLRRVPRRKDGNYDGRFAASRKAAAWMRKVNADLTAYYRAGYDFGPDQAIPLDPFRL